MGGSKSGIKTVIVLAGGKSAEEHDLKNLRKKGFVIGVNDAAIHVPVDAAVTMDRTWYLNRWDKVKALDIEMHARREATVNVPDIWPKLHIFDCDSHSYLMTDKKGHLDGVSSGFCALNLAYQMKPEKVIALGFDCNPTGYWYPPYEWQPQRGITSPWAYSRWQKAIGKVADQFKQAGIKWHLN